MKEGKAKENSVSTEDPLASEQQEIGHDHIKQARGEDRRRLLDDLGDNLGPGGYKELMKI
jgi:hypothetical protein